MGDAFVDEFEAALDRLAQSPLGNARVHGTVRRALLRRFPYLLWYRVTDDTVVVLACTHGRRSPVRVGSKLR